jgi:hypothetical protein
VSDALAEFKNRYPSLIGNSADHIIKIARVSERGKHGIAIRRWLENIAIAGVIAGKRVVAETSQRRGKD